MPLHHDEDVIVHVDNITFFLMNITSFMYYFTASLPNLFYDSESIMGGPKKKCPVTD